MTFYRGKTVLNLGTKNVYLLYIKKLCLHIVKWVWATQLNLFQSPNKQTGELNDPTSKTIEDVGKEIVKKLLSFEGDVRGVILWTGLASLKLKWWSIGTGQHFRQNPNFKYLIVKSDSWRWKITCV